MFCNELVSDAADDGAAVPSASFSENEVVKLAKRPRLFNDISTGTIFFLTRQFVAAVMSMATLARIFAAKAVVGAPCALGYKCGGSIS